MHSDCASVLLGFYGVKAKALLSDTCDLWDDVWEESLARGNCQIDQIKVKVHTAAEQVASGQIEEYLPSCRGFLCEGRGSAA